VGWVIAVLFMQLFCKVILDCWRLTVTWCIKCCIDACILCFPSFTGNRNNIEIFLYNWRARYMFAYIGHADRETDRRPYRSGVIIGSVCHWYELELCYYFGRQLTSCTPWCPSHDAVTPLLPRYHRSLIATRRYLAAVSKEIVRGLATSNHRATREYSVYNRSSDNAAERTRCWHFYISFSIETCRTRLWLWLTSIRVQVISLIHSICAALVAVKSNRSVVYVCLCVRTITKNRITFHIHRYFARWFTLTISISSYRPRYVKIHG